MAFNNYSRGGQSGLEKKLDAIVDDLRRLKVCESQTVAVQQTTFGQVLTVKPRTRGGGDVTISRFKIKSVGNNSYSCVEWDGTTEGSTVEIAKPWKLRSSPFNGRTIGGYTYSYTGATTRVKSTATESENQEIIPTYDLDFDEIYAVKIEGATGVSGVDWLDLNLDGRAWAKV